MRSSKGPLYQEGAVAEGDWGRNPRRSGNLPLGEGFRAGRFVYLHPILPHMLTKRPRFLLETGDIFIFSYCSAKIFSTAAGSSGREAMRAAASLTEPKPYSVKMNGIPAFAAASASPCVSPT